MSSTTITWLHLSDAHIGDDAHDWTASPILTSLIRDLERMATSQRLRPDLIFFTGDIAFGSSCVIIP